MRPVFLSPASTRERSPFARRATSFVLTIAAHVLIVLLLFRLAPPLTPPPPESESLTTFTVSPDARASAQPAPKPRAVARAVTRASAASPAAAPAPAPVPVPAKTPPPPPLMGGVELFEAGDIGKIQGTADGASGEGEGKDSVAAYGPGQGPGGQKLYNAEWYREPTRAEIAGYLPEGAPPGGWALIACRTIEDYHVDNCRSLGEGPVGSGLARAMRQAAWQFRVRAPRLGGKPIMGAWVRIRFDFDRGTAS